MTAGTSRPTPLSVRRWQYTGFWDIGFWKRCTSERGVCYCREVDLPINYRGLDLDVRYRADFVCFDSILVDVKALDRLRDRDDSQVINYLEASRLGRGILLNFGASSLQFRRFVGQTYSWTSVASA